MTEQEAAMGTKTALDQLLQDEQAIVTRMLVLLEEAESITIQINDHPPYPRFSPEYDGWHKAAVYSRQRKINDHRRLKMHLKNLRELIRNEQKRVAREFKTRIRTLTDVDRQNPHTLIAYAAHAMERLSMEGVALTDEEQDLVRALKAYIAHPNTKTKHTTHVLRR
jgi:hypothetical protein